MVKVPTYKLKIFKSMSKSKKKAIRKARMKVHKKRQKALNRQDGPIQQYPRPYLSNWPGKPKQYIVCAGKGESKVNRDIRAAHKFGNLLQKYGFSKKGLNCGPKYVAKEVLHCIRKTEECLNIIKELIPMYQKR